MQRIRLLQFIYPAIVMETPQYLPSIAINKYILANQTGVGVLKSHAPESIVIKPGY